MKLKTDKPEIYQMMGDYYRLIEALYGEKDLYRIESLCDKFQVKWLNCLEGFDKYLVEELLMTLYRAIDKERMDERIVYGWDTDGFIGEWMDADIDLPFH